MTKPQRTVVPDGTIADLINAGDRRKELQHLSPSDRDKKVKERRKNEARRPRRVTYDLSPYIKRRIKELAGEKRIPASQLAALALTKFILEVDQGLIDLDRYKVPARSIRYEYVINIPDKLEDF